MADCKENNLQGGFTLIELLIALTVLAIGLLSIAGMQITAIRNNAASNTLSVRAALAQRVMEHIISRNTADPFFDSAVTDAVHDLDPEDAGETELYVADASPYSAAYTLSTNDPVAGVSRIVVTITGPGNIGQTTLTSFKRAL